MERAGDAHRKWARANLSAGEKWVVVFCEEIQIDAKQIKRSGCLHRAGPAFKRDLLNYVDQS
jgi:hypothetical protein